LLGAFALSYEGRETGISVPAQRLLAFLAVHDHAVLRDHVAETLWLDSTQERAAGSLRSALFKLRQAVSCELVEVSQGRLRLASAVAVDMREATAWAHSVLDPAATEAQLSIDRLPLASDMLPDWYDEWVVLERERFRQLRVHALETLCARLTSIGRFADAIEVGMSAIMSDPLRESAHRAVMKVHLAEGNRAEALDIYQRFRGRLRDALGLTPSALMDELVGQILVQ
jgi:DNA-binding SARP family transcriptional activator